MKPAEKFDLLMIILDEWQSELQKYDLPYHKPNLDKSKINRRFVRLKGDDGNLIICYDRKTGHFGDPYDELDDNLYLKAKLRRNICLISNALSEAIQRSERK